jgi:hypothetical protein
LLGEPFGEVAAYSMLRGFAAKEDITAERRRARRNGSAAKSVRVTAREMRTNGRPPPPRLRRGHRSFMRRWQAGTGVV